MSLAFSLPRRSSAVSNCWERSIRTSKMTCEEALRILEHSPYLGDVIPGSSGIRKLRIPNSDAAEAKAAATGCCMSCRTDRELIGLLLLYSKSEQTDVVRSELIDLLRSLSQDLGESYIHDEGVDYQIENDVSPSI